MKHTGYPIKGERFSAAGVRPAPRRMLPVRRTAAFWTESR